MAADGVYFIHEYNRRRGGLCLFKCVAHAVGADAYEHFYEFGTGNVEEWNAGFIRYGFGQKRLAGSGTAHQEHASRDAGAKFVELFWFAEEFYNFFNFLFCLNKTGNVTEHGALLAFRSAVNQFGFRAPKVHGLHGAFLRLPEKEPEDCAYENKRQNIREHGG